MSRLPPQLGAVRPSIQAPRGPPRCPPTGTVHGPRSRGIQPRSEGPTATAGAIRIRTRFGQRNSGRRARIGLGAASFLAVVSARSLSEPFRISGRTRTTRGGSPAPANNSGPDLNSPRSARDLRLGRERPPSSRSLRPTGDPLAAREGIRFRSRVPWGRTGERRDTTGRVPLGVPPNFRRRWQVPRQSLPRKDRGVGRPVGGDRRWCPARSRLRPPSGVGRGPLTSRQVGEVASPVRRSDPRRGRTGGPIPGLRRCSGRTRSGKRGGES